MANMLQEKHSEVHILITKSNSGNFTYDGIELGGERASQEILGEIERLHSRGHQIKRLSFVGYSLGGLVARYAIGLFESMEIFKDIQLMVRRFVPIHLCHSLNGVTELYNIRHSTSRSTGASTWMAQLVVECIGSQDIADIRPATVHDRQVQRNGKTTARNPCRL